ncbi:hypothetical protein [Streptomyces turgidiscabies]|nr:hypothetical protein [Streptomyces turgidiscabies]
MSRRTQTKLHPRHNTGLPTDSSALQIPLRHRRVVAISGKKI